MSSYNEQESLNPPERWAVEWDNGHASGHFPNLFESAKEAAAWARVWKRDMVAMDPKPREARQAYSWEVVEVL